jgi:putrescine aminotransferase
LTPTFGFLVHPLSELTLRVFAARGLKWPILWARPGDTHRFAFDAALISRVTTFPRIIGDSGAECSGEIIGIPALPAFMLADQERSVALITHAIQTLAADRDLIGLGGLCAIVGSRGQEVQRRVDKPTTTGHSLTCWAAAETVQTLLEALTSCPRFRPRALIVGFPGTMATALVEVLAERGIPVEVGARSMGARHQSWLEDLRAQTGAPIPAWTDMDAALAEKGIVIGASSVGGELASANLRPGTIVVDVAQPLDTTPAQRARTDLLIVEGEMVSLPRASGDSWRSFWSGLYNFSVGQVDRRVFACLAEPMVLCLEGKLESFSLGRTLDSAKVESLGTAARNHGFRVGDLFQGRTCIQPHQLREFAQVPWLP